MRVFNRVFFLCMLPPTGFSRALWKPPYDGAGKGLCTWRKMRGWPVVFYSRRRKQCAAAAASAASIFCRCRCCIARVAHVIARGWGRTPAGCCMHSLRLCTRSAYVHIGKHGNLTPARFSPVITPPLLPPPPLLPSTCPPPDGDHDAMAKAKAKAEAARQKSEEKRFGSLA